jgi:hypothetical protein
LQGYLSILEQKRLIEKTDNGLSILGITTRGTLAHAADFFVDAHPTQIEYAAITLAEACSQEPLLLKEATEYISDTHKLTSQDTSEFLEQAQQIGFIDSEGSGQDKLLFNGNLFKRDTAQKASKVLESLNSIEQQKYLEFNSLLNAQGCIETTFAESILGHQLFDKLKAAAVYDINIVENNTGEYAFITSPSAFHKFVDPLIDDCFDLAKALVAALKYGMTRSPHSQGRIQMIDVLLNKLIKGHSVGPATAIGRDYHYLEYHRVVQIRPKGDGTFYMSLLKKDVGELALQVLTTGDANAVSLNSLPQAAMTGFSGPENNRTRVRKHQTPPSKRGTMDVLSALRGGRSL